MVDPSAWLAPDVVLTGDVVVHPRANLWFGVVARGDVERIAIGRRSNVQDGVILHTDRGYPLIIGSDVAIGHGAVVHGCRVADGVLIGMGATVMSGAVIGADAVIGAGALVLQGAEIPERTVAVGVPAAVVGEARGDEGRTACKRYLARAASYRDAGVGVNECSASPD